MKKVPAAFSEKPYLRAAAKIVSLRLPRSWFWNSGASEALKAQTNAAKASTGLVLTLATVVLAEVATPIEEALEEVAAFATAVVLIRGPL